MSGAFVKGPLTRFAIANGHRVLRALGATWRIRHWGAGSVAAARQSRGPVLYAFTHGVLLPLAFTHRGRNVQLLISESRDGEIITQITSRLGFGAARGSSSRGGAKAVLRLARLGREGHDLAITPDGPRGPRGSVAPGVRLVAERAEVPIVPVGVAARPAWHARSWDRFLVPPPGARVWVGYGPALRPEPDEDDDALARRIARAMADVEAECLRLANGGEPVDAWQRGPA